MDYSVVLRVKRKTRKGTVGGKYFCQENNCNFTTNHKYSLKGHQKNVHDKIARYTADTICA